jgi:CheY-like chemotaxis protein
MNLEETRKYIERRMSDVGLSIRIDSSGYQAIQNYTRGDTERLNQLYYKLVSVGSRQERREVNGVTIQIAIDDLRRMDEFMDHLPGKLEHSEKVDTDRFTIEQLASSLEQKVAEEIEAAVAEARKKKNGAEALDPDSSGNGADHGAADADEVAVAEVGTQPSGKPCILVVDDSPTIRAAVTKALQNDFELIEASDGAKGWEILCANSRIKLVVTDLMMPNMDGFALIERIRSAKIPGLADLPIIVVTALEDPQAKVHALVAGANDFITKRTDTQELQARVMARYQLSQIVGNPLYAVGERTPKDAGPPPHEIAAALLGTRTSRKTSQPSLNIAAAARLHGRPGHVAAVGGQITASSPHHGLERPGTGERSGRGAWARISTTTGITVVASLLVVAAIAGILYINQMPTESATAVSEVSGAVAAARDPAAPSRDPAGATTSPPETSAGTDDTKASDKPIADSWATADGAPTREKLDPASDEAPTRETPTRQAPKDAAKVEVEQPASAPTTQRAETDVATKPPPAPVRAKRTVASVASKPVLDPVTSAPATVKAMAPAPKPSTATISAAADVETKPPPSSTSTATASTSNPTSAIQVPMPVPVPVVSVPVPVPVVPEPPAPKRAPAAAVTSSEPVTRLPGMAPDSVVALAQPPRAISDPATNAQLTQTELTNLIHRFVFVYQAGDLQQFLSLFDDSVRTNDRTSKAGLRADYEDLFHNTSMRQMTLDDITWDIRDQTAEGAANFEVRVRRVNDNQVRVYHGSLTFRVEKIGGRPRIVRMYHGQWRAQS